MVEKISTVKNPLTIIAIFAGLAEVSGTIVLPFINAGSQEIFIWFLIAFPCLLVLCFFVTLNFNHRVLYAPSDFQNEENFLALSKASSEEISLKRKKEVAELEETSEIKGNKVVAYGSNKNDLESPQKSQLVAKYLLAEDLAYQKIAIDYSADVTREAKIKIGNRDFIFDGIISKEDTLNILEIKFRQGDSSPSTLIDSFRRVANEINRLSTFRKKITFIYTVVFDGIGTNNEAIREKLIKMSNSYNFAVDIRFYNMQALEEELLE